jgi:adenylate cyclase, class 2
MNTQEIECRFLEVDKKALIKRLRELKAKNRGEKLLEEKVLYMTDKKWKHGLGFIRIRKSGEEITLTYKEHRKHTVDGAFEIEFGIDDYKKAELFLETIGWGNGREQQKKRHTFVLDGVTIDIDTWPRIPPYVELEGKNETKLKKVAKKLGFDWKEAEFHNARWVIENVYNIPVGEMKYFTFDRFE